MVYYGVSFSTPTLGGNMYLNFFLASIIEIPANYVSIWAMGKYVDSALLNLEKDYLFQFVIVRAALRTVSGKGGRDLAFPPFFTIIPHPELLSSLSRKAFLSQSAFEPKFWRILLLG